MFQNVAELMEHSIAISLLDITRKGLAAIFTGALIAKKIQIPLGKL